MNTAATKRAVWRLDLLYSAMDEGIEDLENTIITVSQADFKRSADVEISATDLLALLDDADEVERLQKENKYLREAEFHARKMAGECELCPHLGVGEPLVDEQERELERLRACVGEITAAAVDTLTDDEVRAIIARHTV